MNLKLLIVLLDRLKKVQGKKQREGEASEAERKAIMAAAYDDDDKENGKVSVESKEAENILGDNEDEDVIF